MASISSSGGGLAGQANLSDLKDVLKETLDARGSLSQIKARIRAEIFAALDDQDVPKPKLSNDNLLINELIREYLEYNGYRHTLSVFLPESGQPTERPFPREFLAQELTIEEDPRFTHVPLLYSLVAGLQQQARARRRDSKNSSDSANARLRAAAPSSLDPVDDGTLQHHHQQQLRASTPRQPSAGGVADPSPLMFRK